MNNQLLNHYHGLFNSQNSHAFERKTPVDTVMSMQFITIKGIISKIYFNFM